MYYLVSTKNDWFNTTDEKLASENYTIEMLIDDLKDDPVNKLMFVDRKVENTRQYKYEDFWLVGEGYKCVS